MILIVIIADTPSDRHIVAPAKDRSIGFESPQLHQEVRASKGEFRLPRLPRSFNRLAEAKAVYADPHEEGIDYEGATCPACPFWAGRDRWTGTRLH
jgi:hypothetical protein